MKRTIIYPDIQFYIGNYTPRNNEYEKGLKYKIFVGPGNIPTNHCFSTIKEAKEYLKNNWIYFR